MKKKILKTILVVFLICLVIFIANFARKYIILKDIMKKAAQNAEATNYHRVQYQYDGPNYQISDGYCKDGKSKVTHTNLGSDEIVRKIIMVRNEGKTNTYIEAGDTKIAHLGLENQLDVADFSTGFEDFTTKEFLYTLLTLRISTDYIEEKECYKLTAIAPGIGSLLPMDFQYNYFEFMKDKNNVYYEKDTGLMLRYEFTSRVSISSDEGNKLIIQETLWDSRYEFDTVTDEDLKEPDISQYRVEEEN